MTRRFAELTVADVDAVQRLFADDGDYSARVSGRPATRQDAVDALTERPPGTDPTAKLVVGLYDAGELVGLADVIRGWPSAEHAHIGLLQTAASRSRRGLGRALHAEVVARVARWPEVTTLRIGVVDANREFADPFWEALGYTPTGESKPFESEAVRSRARIWVRPVAR